MRTSNREKEQKKGENLLKKIGKTALHSFLAFFTYSHFLSSTVYKTLFTGTLPSQLGKLTLLTLVYVSEKIEKIKEDTGKKELKERTKKWLKYRKKDPLCFLFLKLTFGKGLAIWPTLRSYSNWYWSNETIKTTVSFFAFFLFFRFPFFCFCLFFFFYFFLFSILFLTCSSHLSDNLIAGTLPTELGNLEGLWEM